MPIKLSASDKRSSADQTMENEQFLQLVGAELRGMRKKANLPLQAVCDVFGWDRTAMSKIELGHRAISLNHYLQLMAFYRDIDPKHPGVALASYYKAKAGKRKLPATSDQRRE